MEFNNIQLPAITMVGLFKHSLVLVEGEKIANGQLEIVTEKLPTFVAETLISSEPQVPFQKTELNNVQPESRKIAPIGVNKIANNPLLEITEIKDNDTTFAATPNPQTQNNEPVNKIKYLGGFGKKVSIVLADHFHPHINDSDLAFLTKLLQACQLSLNDVAIINVASNHSYSNQLWQLMPAEKMIIFEIDPGTLGLPFRLSHFKLQPWDDCIFLAAPSLETLQAGTSEIVIQLKRSLWESLKKTFLS